jgi:hypothetical protein
MESQPEAGKELQPGLLGTVKSECELSLTVGCSMHVHVSPHQSAWGCGCGCGCGFGRGQLGGVCKALCFYDCAITDGAGVMPAERKNSELVPAGRKVNAWCPWGTRTISGARRAQRDRVIPGGRKDNESAASNAARCGRQASSQEVALLVRCSR